MMKYLNLTGFWAACISAFILVSDLGFLTEAEPTDDFSFSLEHPSDLKVYRVMSDSQVGAILEDRLDTFPKSQVSRLAKHIEILCQQYRFDPAFVLSLISVESGFRVKATSPMGAVGLMQLMPATAQHVVDELGFIYSGQENFTGERLRDQKLTFAVLADPFVNTALGIAYLAWLRDHYRGFPPYYVFAAYNVGPGRMDELIARKSFRPRDPQNYFRLIRSRVPDFRFYSPQSTRRI